MKIESRKLSDLKLWSKNPRAIEEVDLERLKNLIKKLGLFKPFLIVEDGTILGGNMRFLACKDLDIQEVTVSIVKADTDEKKLEYALADNDRAGYYVEEKLKKLILNTPNLDLQAFTIDLNTPYSLKEIMNFEFHNSENIVDEDEFNNYLKENQDKTLLKILTTTNIERQIRNKINENKNEEDEDEGEILLELIS